MEACAHGGEQEIGNRKCRCNSRSLRDDRQKSKSEKQIPKGNDRKKNKSNCKSKNNYRGLSLRSG
jgi:hypothetical protein